MIQATSRVCGLSSIQHTRRTSHMVCHIDVHNGRVLRGNSNLGDAPVLTTGEADSISVFKIPTAILLETFSLQGERHPCCERIMQY